MLPMAPSRVAGGLTQSSSRSGIFFQGDGQSQNVVNSHLSSPFVNSSNTVPGNGRSNLGLVSRDMNNAVLNSVANSAPSVGANSMVTDGNSALSGGPHMQRSASFNTDSYMRLPASPMSFTSNNISISGSPVMDGSSVVQQNNSHQDQIAQQLQQNQQLQQSAPGATSLPASQTGPSAPQMGAQVVGSMVQDPNTVSHPLKKPRLDIIQGDLMHNQALQQLLQRQETIQFQGRNPQFQQALFLQQQQRVRQQQILQHHLQQAHLQQQQQQQPMQLRQQLQQQMMQPVSSVKRPYDSGVNGVCARRLMQYLYHQRERRNDNSIAYWRKFVVEYYSPRAKQRWCLSLYNNVANHALGVFPQVSMDAWQCDICGSKSGKGFEATFDVLPRLNEIKFGSGVIDELLFLDLPHESKLPSGAMVLEYQKAVQECVYEQLRVVREGKLRIIFTQDLKIFSWEFCARRHEELLPRKFVAPQVNQLVQVAQKCQSTIAQSGSDGVSQEDLKTNSNMVLTAGRQLAKSLELPSLNDLGFSKRYVRCLQIAEVCSSMKDLIDICYEHKIGPIESLKNFPRLATSAKLQTQKTPELEQLANVQGLPTDRNTLNKLMASNPGLSDHINNNHNTANRCGLGGSAVQAAIALNYQNHIMRQNSMNSSPGSLQQEGPSFNNSNQSPSSALQGAGSMQNSPISGLPSPQIHHQPHQHQQQQHLSQRSLNANSSHQQNQSPRSQGNHAEQVHQLMQMSNNNGGAQPPSRGGPIANGNMVKNGPGFVGQTPPIPGGGSGNVHGNNGAVSRSHSFKAASSSDSYAAGGNNGFNQRTSDIIQHRHQQQEQDVVQNITHEFTDDFFNSDLDDNLAFV